MARYNEDMNEISKQKVWIMVRTQTRYEGDDSEQASWRVRGAVEHLPGGFLLRYTEPGPTSARVILRADAERAVLTRYAEARNELVFVPGKRSELLYVTPCGTLPLLLHTDLLRLRIAGRGGALSLRYSSVLGGAAHSTHRLDILFRMEDSI